MTDGRGNKATVNLILTHFKDDLAHMQTLAQGMWTGKV
jgi:hypothetical protein